MEPLLKCIEVFDSRENVGRILERGYIQKSNSIIKSLSRGVVPQIENKLVNDLSEFIETELRHDNFAQIEFCAEVLEYVETSEARNQYLMNGSWLVIVGNNIRA